MLQLTPRLKAIADKIPQGSVVADIGTDHGYLAIYLILQKICSRVIGIDVKPLPIRQAKHNVAHHRLMQEIDIRLGDGLQVLEFKEIDVIVIAGMGGYKMVKILEKNIDKAQCAHKIILQPMRDLAVVLEWLMRNNFVVEESILVREEERFYSVVVAKIL